jgi:hypothetical protein
MIKACCFCRLFASHTHQNLHLTSTIAAPSDLMTSQTMLIWREFSVISSFVRVHTKMLSIWVLRFSKFVNSKVYCAPKSVGPFHEELFLWDFQLVLSMRVIWADIKVSIIFYKGIATIWSRFPVWLRVRLDHFEVSTITIYRWPTAYFCRSSINLFPVSTC